MSQDFDRELARLWRVHRTAQEMIADRVSLEDEGGAKDLG